PYRDRIVLTNPPPSAGGILLAYTLALLDRGPAPPTLEGVVEAMAAAQAERTAEFVEGLAEGGFLERFLSSRLGATTHIPVDDRGRRGPWPERRGGRGGPAGALRRRGPLYGAGHRRAGARRHRSAARALQRSEPVLRGRAGGAAPRTAALGRRRPAPRRSRGVRVSRAGQGRRRSLACVASLTACALLLAATVAGCGGVRAADLFLVERAGSAPGARLTMLV